MSPAPPVPCSHHLPSHPNILPTAPRSQPLLIEVTLVSSGLRNPEQKSRPQAGGSSDPRAFWEA